MATCLPVRPKVSLHPPAPRRLREDGGEQIELAERSEPRGNPKRKDCPDLCDIARPGPNGSSGAQASAGPEKKRDEAR